MRSASSRLPDATYVELVQGLFETLPPALAMSGMVLAIGFVAHQRAGDPALLGLLAAAGLASILRIGHVAGWRRHARQIREREEAVPLERGFAVTATLFALALGLFCARMFWLRPADLHTLAAVLVAGYCAGVGAGLYGRPAIAVACILLSIVPITLVAAVSPLATDRLLALTFAVFTAAGLGSVFSRYRSDAAKISQRLKLASLSRYDGLTSLPNRLALLEEYEAVTAGANRERPVWLHCLTLDGVAEVNLAHGQAAGDRLVKLAASRLSGVVGDSGLPVRLGGVEFAVLQAQIHHSSEAEHLARRIVAALGEPYPLGEGGGEARLSASIGFARGNRRIGAAQGLDYLLDTAEAAMSQVRREGGNAAARAA